VASFIPVSVFVFAAGIGFVHLDDPAQLLNRIFNQSGSDLVAHAPSGFVTTEAHDALHLEVRNALLAGRHHVHDAMPVAQRLVRVFEDRANRVREPVAFRGAFRPAARDQVGAASVFVPDMASNSGMVS
jgi:hypothetical protein